MDTVQDIFFGIFDGEISMEKSPLSQFLDRFVYALKQRKFISEAIFPLGTAEKCRYDAVIDFTGVDKPIHNPLMV